MKIKNLLEELKLTKAAQGDSGAEVAELSKSLRSSRETVSKLEQELSELKQTLETRTQNMLKEKSELKQQLDKALEDLKTLQRSSGGSDAENARLKEEVSSLKKKLSDTELQLDII